MIDFNTLFPEACRGRRIGVLGGGFDPPHIAHQLLALSVIATEAIDRLWVIPCADHPTKKTTAPFADRVAMCELAFARIRNAHVISIEAHLPGPNYALNTIAFLKQQFPGTDFSYVIGSDHLGDIEQWHHVDELFKLCKPIVVAREGYPIEQLPAVLSGECVHQGYRLPDAQSHVIRDGGPQQLVDQDVVAYMARRRLY